MCSRAANVLMWSCHVLLLRCAVRSVAEDMARASATAAANCEANPLVPADHHTAGDDAFSDGNTNATTSAAAAAAAAAAVAGGSDSGGIAAASSDISDEATVAAAAAAGSSNGKNHDETSDKPAGASGLEDRSVEKDTSAEDQAAPEVVAKQQLAGVLAAGEPQAKSGPT